MAIGTREGEFDRFFEKERRALLRQAYALTGDAQEAQDLVQDTLLRVWRNWRKVGALDCPEAWARRVLHNLAVSSWRRKRTRWQHPRHEAHWRNDTPAIGHLDVATAIRSLPANQRKALVLRTIVGMTAAEVASELGTTEATVRSWLARARAALAVELALSDSASVRGGEPDGVARRHDPS